jgi:hypothetical protein
MTYGRDLNEEEKEHQDTKQYPYAFPPKKSFMNWFLNNRSIHIYISIVGSHPIYFQPRKVFPVQIIELLTSVQSVLVFLALFINIKNFEQSNKFPELIPHGSLFFRNPLRYISEYIQAYRLHMGAVNAEVAAKREQEVDDARKRRLYREAHNIPEVSGLAARLGLGTLEEEARVAKMKKAEDAAADMRKGTMISRRIMDEQSPQNLLQDDIAGLDKDVTLSKSIVDQKTSQNHLERDATIESEADIRPKRKVRKWFGIW